MNRRLLRLSQKVAVSPKISRAKALVRFLRCRAALGAAPEEIESKQTGTRCWAASKVCATIYAIKTSKEFGSLASLSSK